MTLFVFPELTIRRFKNEYGLDISAHFLNCADMQLTEKFINQTGLKFNKNLCISWVSKDRFKYSKGETSQITFYLYVNHNWNDINILWTSKSGKIYDIADTKIDCDDIIFSFEHLDIDLYVKQLFPNQKLPFKISALNYELIVTRINLDATFKLAIKSQFIGDEEQIIKSIYEFIEDFNTKSIMNERKDGVVHIVKPNHERGTIVLEIDMGSTGISFLKKFLKFLNKLDRFSKVEIE